MTGRAFTSLEEPLTQATLTKDVRTWRRHEGIQIDKLLANEAFEDTIMVFIGKYVLQVKAHL